MSKICFDTSSLLALYVHEHPNHTPCANYYLDHVESAEFYIASHSIAEMYRHLTSGRAYFSYPPTDAHTLLRTIIPEYFNPVSLDHADYMHVMDRMKDLSLHGAIIYDALIAKAAEKTGCDKLVTYNIRDFHRVWPLTTADLIEP